MTHTPQGGTILRQFPDRRSAAARARGSWAISPARRSSAVRRRVGDGRVICGLSGGVDSAVVAALLSQAIGPQLSCILVDNGLLRKDEEEAVIREFTDHFKTDLHVVQAEDRFLAALAGVTDPQEKRRRIGHAFIECFADEAAKIDGRPVPRPGHALSRRDRERRPRPTARPPRSSCTTTWADCPRTWPSS